LLPASPLPLLPLSSPLPLRIDGPHAAIAAIKIPAVSALMRENVVEAAARGNQIVNETHDATGDLCTIMRIARSGSPLPPRPQ
jgi:hypothetical protein